ncbi:hypothetical protein [Parabacteroides sp.]
MDNFYRIAALVFGFILVLIAVKCELDPAGAFFIGLSGVAMMFYGLIKHVDI